MKEINRNINDNDFHSSYLLYGDERYLVNTYRKKLIDAICGDDTMNLTVFQGKDTEIGEVRDTSSTMPFFAERRLIVIDDSGMFKSSSEEMAKILKEAPETTIFLFTDSVVDKRNRLFKAVKDTGYVCEMKTQSDRELAEWVVKICGKYKKRISQSDAAKLVGLAGPDMNNILNETMKLVSYAGDLEEITSDDIDRVVSVQPENRVFDMIDAMASREKDKAVRLYGDLVELREPPVKILALMSGHFQKLLTVSDMTASGKDKKEIAQQAGIPPYFVGKYIKQADSLGRDRIRKSLVDCVNTDYRIKSGISEDKYSVELLIAKFCSM